MGIGKVVIVVIVLVKVATLTEVVVVIVVKKAALNLHTNDACIVVVVVVIVVVVATLVVVVVVVVMKIATPSLDSNNIGHGGQKPTYLPKTAHMAETPIRHVCIESDAIFMVLGIIFLLVLGCFFAGFFVLFWGYGGITPVTISPLFMVFGRFSF